ncbi:MAG: GTPase Era [Trueperella sp.]|nr:GTPase Era [Trueperella sp.]
MNTEFENFRAGFVSVVGRPNAGKSTLTNALVGSKVAITADQPETTRRIIRGIVQLEQGQLIVVDTPGMHRPRTLLGERLNDMVRESLVDMDAIMVCLPANEPIGPGDRFLLEKVKAAQTPVFAVVTKADLVDKAAMADKLIEISQLADIKFAEIVPVSAVRGEQIELLAELVAKQMPVSPPLYPRDMATDQSEETMVAELIREAALVGVREELPHSIAVLVEEMAPRLRKDGSELIAIQADVYVERPSQKGIIIGKKGARLREVGTRARSSLEKMLGQQVYLDLHVRVAKEWQRDPKLLSRLGF